MMLQPILNHLFVVFFLPLQKAAADAVVDPRAARIAETRTSSGWIAAIGLVCLALQVRCLTRLEACGPEERARVPEVRWQTLALLATTVPAVLVALGVMQAVPFQWLGMIAWI